MGNKKIIDGAHARATHLGMHPPLRGLDCLNVLLHFSLERVGQDLVGCNCTSSISWQVRWFSFFEYRQKTGVKTIEGELFKALVNVGAVSADNADDPVSAF